MQQEARDELMAVCDRVQERKLAARQEELDNTVADVAKRLFALAGHMEVVDQDQINLGISLMSLKAYGGGDQQQVKRSLNNLAQSLDKLSVVASQLSALAKQNS